MGDLFSHVRTCMYIVCMYVVCMYAWVTLYKCCRLAWECRGLCLIGASGARQTAAQSLCWAVRVSRR